MDAQRVASLMFYLLHTTHYVPDSSAHFIRTTSWEADISPLLQMRKLWSNGLSVVEPGLHSGWPDHKETKIPLPLRERNAFIHLSCTYWASSVRLAPWKTLRIQQGARQTLSCSQTGYGPTARERGNQTSICYDRGVLARVLQRNQTNRRDRDTPTDFKELACDCGSHKSEVPRAAPEARNSDKTWCCNLESWVCRAGQQPGNSSVAMSQSRDRIVPSLGSFGSCSEGLQRIGWGPPHYGGSFALLTANWLQMLTPSPMPSLWHPD